VVIKNLTTGETLVTAGVLYDDGGGTRPVAAGQSAPQQSAFRLPDGARGVGNIQFTVTTDSGNTVLEYTSAGTAETNNTTSYAQHAALATYPDLVVANLRLDPATGLQSGQDVVIRWDDRNAGNRATADSWTDSLVVKNLTTGETLTAVNVLYDPTGTGN